MVFESILREVSIGINYVEVALLVEIFFYYVMNYFREDFEDKPKDKMVLVTSFAFLFSACARVFYIIYDYYVSSTFFIIIAWSFLGTGIALLFLGVFKGALTNVLKEFPNKTAYVISILVIIGVGVVFRFFINIIWIIPIMFG
ncbi:MAG: hypothetical protein ACTSVE_03350, partial [Candidatus Helarchaeota archaeon]